jgi:hypothetical protein
MADDGPVSNVKFIREQVTYLNDTQQFLARLRFNILYLEVNCSCLIFLYGCLQFQA